MTFWRLDLPPDDDLSTLAQWTKDVKAKWIECPLDEGHSRGGGRIGELSAHTTARHPPDFLWTGCFEIFCSEKAAAVFEAASLTGYELHPAKLTAGRPKKQVAYREFKAIGWGGLVHGGRSMIKLQDCPACHFRRVQFPSLGKVVDENSWDGSDFFRVWPIGGEFCSDRAASVIESAGLTGIELRPADRLDLRGSDFPAGSLEGWLPPERAREIGEPLGLYP
jgi:hypothetical protein